MAERDAGAQVFEQQVAHAATQEANEGSAAASENAANAEATANGADAGTINGNAAPAPTVKPDQDAESEADELSNMMDWRRWVPGVWNRFQMYETKEELVKDKYSDEVGDLQCWCQWRVQQYCHGRRPTQSYCLYCFSRVTAKCTLLIWIGRKGQTTSWMLNHAGMRVASRCGDACGFRLTLAVEPKMSTDNPTSWSVSLILVLLTCVAGGHRGVQRAEQDASPSSTRRLSRRRRSRVFLARRQQVVQRWNREGVFLVLGQGCCR